MREDKHRRKRRKIFGQGGEEDWRSNRRELLGKGKHTNDVANTRGETRNKELLQGGRKRRVGKGGSSIAKNIIDCKDPKTYAVLLSNYNDYNDYNDCNDYNNYRDSDLDLD